MKPLAFRRPCAALVLLAVAACEDGATGPAAPAAMVAMRAVMQEAVAGLPVPVLPAVHVSDARGRGVPGVAVTFTVTAGGGTVPASVLTDAGGVAVAADWVMGTVAQENAITATVAGLPPVVFRATAGPGTPAALGKTGGDEQSGTVATALPDSMSVRVVDRYGNGVPGVTVNFSGTAGTLSATRVATGAQGHARVALVLPTRAGPLQVHGDVASLERQNFYITARAAAPATVTRLAGEGQVGFSGSPVPVAPTVHVSDAFGNSVPGHPVVFIPVPGSGTVTGGAAVTDGEGDARVGSWVLGDLGRNRLLAAVVGLDTLKFTAYSQEPCRSRPYTLFTALTDDLRFPSPCSAGGRSAQLYAFTVPSQQCLEFRMSSSVFDTYLYLLNRAGDLLASNDDSGDGGINSFIRITLPPGSYLLGAAAYRNGSTGRFSLSSSPCSAVMAPQRAASKQTP